ncbi:hypothetical protein RIF29_20906 [Crotalaria pallida]|uniref:S1 motif domain-containing protein n=1 Tax=Crotalaria pallida TaxID=3830 RepID=A0AAN9F6D8_CROPI
MLLITCSSAIAIVIVILVSCVALRLDDDKEEKGTRKIWLSLRLSLLHKNFNLHVLAAYVKSIEDHGYILHFGLPSFLGFLPKKSSTEGHVGEVKVGQLLQGLVRKIDKVRKVVYLSSDPDTMCKSVTKDLKGISIDILVPGMMVNARVKSILENGVMLSFLTYFTGTVDLFHLQNIYPAANWKDTYDIGGSHHAIFRKALISLVVLRLIAQILFIDPSSRAVGLTLNPRLVQNKVPPSLTLRFVLRFSASTILPLHHEPRLTLCFDNLGCEVPTPHSFCYVKMEQALNHSMRSSFMGVRPHVKIGDIYDDSKVVRVDKGSGLLLEVPSIPESTPAFISDIAEEEIKKLEKKYREGNLVRVRILGLRHLEGLAIRVLKASALEEAVFTHSDVKPGMVVKAKILSVDSFGAIVQIPGGVKALCLLAHMSELDIVMPGKNSSQGRIISPETDFGRADRLQEHIDCNICPFNKKGDFHDQAPGQGIPDDLYLCLLLNLKDKDQSYFPPPVEMQQYDLNKEERQCHWRDHLCNWLGHCENKHIYEQGVFV